MNKALWRTWSKRKSVNKSWLTRAFLVYFLILDRKKTVVSSPALPILPRTTGTNDFRRSWTFGQSHRSWLWLVCCDKWHYCYPDRAFGSIGSSALFQSSLYLWTVANTKTGCSFLWKIGQQITGFSKEKTLMIGDSLTADIQGGNNAGIDTIWYNSHHLENHTQAQPTYEVHSYKDLLDCLDKL